jgi:hypothetical protein
MPEVSDIWIKLNYWYLNNRRDLTRWWGLLLLGADLILIAFVVINGISSLIGHRTADAWVSEMGTSRIVGSEVTSRNTPSALTVTSIESVSDGKGQMLYVGIIKNPNTFWSAERVQFSFASSQETTDLKETFILAGEERVVLVSGNIGANPTMQFGDVFWKRTPATSLPELQLDFSDAQHKFVTVHGTSGSAQAVSQVTTTVTNNSLYKVKDLKVIVVVRNGDTLVNAKQFFVENLMQREVRDLTFQFPSALGQFSSISFYPEVNILDSSTLDI